MLLRKDKRIWLKRVNEGGKEGRDKGNKSWEPIEQRFNIILSLINSITLSLI